MIVSAAMWRHVCWIVDRHLEDTLEARMAHAVFARQTCRFGDGNIIGATGETWYFGFDGRRLGKEQAREDTGVSAFIGALRGS